MRKIRVIIIVIVLFTLGISVSFQEDTQAKLLPLDKQLQNISLDKVDALMIVAHPDDETIWGGDHLTKGNYLVVCLTNQSNQTRATEFMQVINETHNIGIILDYPDKVNNKRDDWKTVKKAIQKDIRTLLYNKKWTQIVTHNPEGEYGHQHHKMTSAMVSKEVRKQKQEKNLYYFGKYIKKERLKDQQVTIKNKLSKQSLHKKERLTRIYSSQSKVMKKLKHMFPYENFIAYKDWSAS